MKFNTLAVHAGVEPDPSTGAIMTPIFQTSTYVQDAPGEHKGFEYARTQNPTRDALQDSIAALEGGKHGLCFSSGMAAMDAIVKLLKQGDEVVASSDLYGGSFRLLRRIYEKFGIKSHFVDMSDLRNVEAVLNDRTKLLWIETPTNPMLQLVDIAAITKLAKSRGVISCVDNTFATPYLQQPLSLGADLVHHSSTMRHAAVAGGIRLPDLGVALVAGTSKSGSWPTRQAYPRPDSRALCQSQNIVRAVQSG